MIIIEECFWYVNFIWTVYSDATESGRVVFMVDEEVHGSKFIVKLRSESEILKTVTELDTFPVPDKFGRIINHNANV